MIKNLNSDEIESVFIPEVDGVEFAKEQLVEVALVVH